jgi:hypothetical protein
MKQRKELAVKKRRINKHEIESSEEIFPGVFLLPDGSLLNTKCEPEAKYIGNKDGKDSEKK